MERNTDYIGFNIDVLAQGPGSANIELVVAGFFIYDENEPELIGGAKQLNDGLDGLPMQLRTDGTFKGDVQEIHSFQISDGKIPAGNVMLAGLGNKSTFELSIVEKVGYAVFNEANRSGFSKVAFAPEIKDAGVTGFDVGEVLKALVDGLMRAYNELISKGEKVSIQSFFVLAGKAHEQRAKEALEEAVMKHKL